MRAAICAAVLLVSLLVPGPAAANCPTALVPVFPDSVQVGGFVAAGPSGALPSGRSTWATPATLLEIQMFYYIRLTGSGWMDVAQLPGQYPGQFAPSDRGPIVTVLPVLEFSRGGDRERVRIVAEAGGYSAWLECRDS